MFVTQSEGSLPHKVEEEEQEDEGKEKLDNVNELLSRVQELESELKKTEETRWHVLYDHLALQNKLKASQKVLDRVRHKMAILEERLLQVRKMDDLMLYFLLCCM